MLFRSWRKKKWYSFKLLRKNFRFRKFGNQCRLVNFWYSDGDLFLLDLKDSSNFVQHTTNEKLNYHLSAQDGIWVKFFDFWLKNDSEKLSLFFFWNPSTPKTNFFHFTKVKIFAETYKFTDKNEVLCSRRDFKNLFRFMST